MKHLRRILIIIAVLLAAIAIWNIAVLAPFYNIAEKTFSQPDIGGKFDEQGIDYDEESGIIFVGGYMKNKEASPVYLIDQATNKQIKQVNLLDIDGGPFTGHSGGLAVSQQYLYLAGSTDDCLYVYSRDEILNAEDGADINCLGTFPCFTSSEDGVKISFVSICDDVLYVGEFHLPLLPFYKLRANHKITTAQGTTSAIMAAFRLDENGVFGLSSQPFAVYCLPDMVQGVIVNDSEVILSLSFGPFPSTIASYEAVEAGSYELMNAETKLYSLQKISSMVVIPMSEEIVEINGKLYISSELYNMICPAFGNLWDSQYCYAIPSDCVRSE